MKKERRKSRRIVRELRKSKKKMVNEERNMEIMRGKEGEKIWRIERDN